MCELGSDKNEGTGVVGDRGRKTCYNIIWALCLISLAYSSCKEALGTYKLLWRPC